MFRKAAALFLFVTFSFAGNAADYPAPKQGEWIARDFKFHTGEVMAELRCPEPPVPCRTTIGIPSGLPIVM
jgi:homoserine O-acetyltransferase